MKTLSVKLLREMVEENSKRSSFELGLSLDKWTVPGLGRHYGNYGERLFNDLGTTLGDDIEGGIASGVLRRATVRLRDIHQFQLTVSADGVLELVDNFTESKHDPVILMQFGPRFFVRDGNHRCVAAALRGDKTIRALVAQV